MGSVGSRQGATPPEARIGAQESPCQEPGLDVHFHLDTGLGDRLWQADSVRSLQACQVTATRPPSTNWARHELMCTGNLTTVPS